MRPSTAAAPGDAPRTTRHDQLLAARRRRRRHRGGAALAVVLTLVTALPAAATVVGSAPDGAARTGAEPAADPAGAAAIIPERPGGVRPLALIEDEEEWCSYLSSYYVAFPSPWSARVINCRHSSLFVAPLYSDGALGMCVHVPARHSRHLGGNIARWVTDIRLC